MPVRDVVEDIRRGEADLEKLLDVVGPDDGDLVVDPVSVLAPANGLREARNLYL